MSPRLAVLVPLLLLAACASPSQRIATKLGEYGVPPRQAQCMGDRLASRLDYGQLQRLNDLSKIDHDRLGRMSINDIARTFNGPEDATLAAELLRAGIGCAF